MSNSILSLSHSIFGNSLAVILTPFYSTQYIIDNKNLINDEIMSTILKYISVAKGVEILKTFDLFRVARIYHDYFDLRTIRKYNRVLTPDYVSQIKDTIRKIHPEQTEFPH